MSTSSSLIIILASVLVLTLVIVLSYFIYKYYLNLRIQNRCKKRRIVNPKIITVLSVIVLLLIIIGVSHYNYKELKDEFNDYKASSENKNYVLDSISEDNHTYDVYVTGMLNGSLGDYKVTKSVKNDYECYLAFSNKDISFMPKYIYLIRYVGTSASLNGYIKYSFQNSQSMKFYGTIEKSYIIMASNLNLIPKSFEIGLSNVMDKDNENFNVTTFEFVN